MQVGDGEPPKMKVVTIARSKTGSMSLKKLPLPIKPLLGLISQQDPRNLIMKF
jgi:hypothetical protein